MEQFRYGLLVDARNIMFCDDLFVLDIMNQQGQNISFMDKMEIDAMITDAFKNIEKTPSVGVIQDRFNQWHLTNIFGEIGDREELAVSFMKSRRDDFILKDVMKRIVKDYPHLINQTVVSTINPNLFGLLDTPNLFILFDNSVYDMRSKILSLYPNKEEDVIKKLLDRNRLAEFFKTGINPLNDIGVRFTIVTADENIEEFIRTSCDSMPDPYKELLECIGIIVDQTNRAFEVYDRLKNLPEDERMTYALFELWNKNLITKLLSNMKL